MTMHYMETRLGLRSLGRLLSVKRSGIRFFYQDAIPEAEIAYLRFVWRWITVLNL